MAISLGSAFGEVRISASGVLKGAKQAEHALSGLEKHGIASMAALGLSFAAVTAGLVKMVRETTGSAIEFESAVTRLSLAAGDSGESLGELHDAALAVGGDTRLLGVTASEAAESMTGLYKSGLSAGTIFGDLNGYMSGTAELGGALRASIDLAAASELSMVEASDLAVVVLSTFGAELESDAEKAEFVNAAMDNFVKAADASVAEVSDLKEALSNIGPDAARLGFSIEDVNTALALLSTRGIKGAEAGTALKSMLMNISRQTPKVTEALDDLNVQLYDSSGTFLGLPAILGQLETAFAGLTDEQRDQYMQTIAGTYGIKAMSTLVAEGTGGWNDMATAIEGATGIQEKAQTMAQTLGGRIEIMRDNLETLGIQIGEKLMPAAEDWVEWIIEMVEERGPALVETMGKIAGVVGDVSEVLQGNGTAAQNTGIQLLGLGTIGVGAVMAFSKLAPVLVSVGTALKDAYAGAQLLAGGAKLGEVASLGWTAALGPLVLAVGALAVALYAANKAAEIHREAEEKEIEVAGQWTQFLEAQAGTLDDATSVATAYIRKQEEITQVYEDGGIAAQLFIDKQDVANASTGDLSKTLLKTATSYEDYESAVDAINQAQIRHALATRGVNDEMYEALVTSGNMTREEANLRIEEEKLAAVQGRLIPLMGRTSYELVRGTQSMEGGFVAAQMMTEAQGEMTEAQADAQAASRSAAWANQTLGNSLLGTITSMQALGVITRQEAQGMRSVLVDEYGTMTTETEAFKAVQAGLAEASATAWDTFAQNVYTGIQGALTAYREGNKELYAEQQAALGQMVLGQAEVALANKEITETQMRALRVAVHEEYGIAVDEAQVGTDHLTALFADWANRGGTTIEELLAFIGNVGPETEQLAAEQEAALLRADETWVNYRDNVMVHGSEAALAAEEMTTDIGRDLSTMGQEFDTAATKIWGVASALWGLPTEHTFTLRLKTEGALPNLPGAGPEDKGAPYGHNAEGTDYWRGGWSVVGEEGPELVYLNQGAQVLTAQTTSEVLDNLAELAASMRAASLSGGAAVLPEPTVSEQAASPTMVQMTNIVRDELDIELLARKVAEYVRRRA